MHAINNTYTNWQLIETVIPIFAGAIPAVWLTTRLHENGHAFMANRLYNNANPIIYYPPFFPSTGLED